jgi:hypothetical protein
LIVELSVYTTCDFSLIKACCSGDRQTSNWPHRCHQLGLPIRNLSE